MAMSPTQPAKTVITAEGIAKALGGRRVGGGWMARCPAHHDRKPSLSIRDADDGKVLIHCHAGCDQRGVIAILRSRGLWQRERPAPGGCALRLAMVPRGSRIRTTSSASERARHLALHKPAGTLVETYLASRGLHLPVPRRFASMPG